MTECVVIYSVVKETDLHKGLQKTKTNSCFMCKMQSQES